MKKVINFLPVYLLVILIFNACTTDLDSKVENELSLIEQTSKYNNDFIYSNPSNQKGFLDSFGYAAGLFVGDVTGAAAAGASVSWLAGAVGAATAGTGFIVVETIAGVVGAVGGSYMAHCTMRGCSKSANAEYQIFNFPDRYDITLNFPNYDRYSHFGDMHNLNLVENKFGSITNKDFFTNAITNEFPIFNNLNSTENIRIANDLLESNEFQIYVSKIEQNTIDYVENEFDYEFLLQSHYEDNLISITTKDILKNFLDIYTNATGFEDVELMVNDYSEMVIESRISETDKKALLSALSVAAKTLFLF